MDEELQERFEGLEKLLLGKRWDAHRARELSLEIYERCERIISEHYDIGDRKELLKATQNNMNIFFWVTRHQGLDRKEAYDIYVRPPYEALRDFDASSQRGAYRPEKP